MTDAVKHTPGPWLEARRSAGAHIRADGGEVAWLRSHMGLSNNEIEANARLISAAPEILMALREMITEFDADEFGAEAQLQACSKARVAVAKAEGRS